MTPKVFIFGQIRFTKLQIEWIIAECKFWMIKSNLKSVDLFVYILWRQYSLFNKICEKSATYAPPYFVFTILITSTLSSKVILSKYTPCVNSSPKV